MSDLMFQKGQRVKVPDGEGNVEQTTGDEVAVKLDSGEIKTYPADQLEDISNAG